MNKKEVGKAVTEFKKLFHDEQEHKITNVEKQFFSNLTLVGESK